MVIQGRGMARGDCQLARHGSGRLTGTCRSVSIDM
jgi:hypothetical protein